MLDLPILLYKVATIVAAATSAEEILAPCLSPFPPFDLQSILLPNDHAVAERQDDTSAAKKPYNKINQSTSSTLRSWSAWNQHYGGRIACIFVATRVLFHVALIIISVSDPAVQNPQIAACEPACSNLSVGPPAAGLRVIPVSAGVQHLYHS